MAKKNDGKLTVNSNLKEFKGEHFKTKRQDGIAISFKKATYQRYYYSTIYDLNFVDNGKRIEISVTANNVKGLKAAEATIASLKKIGINDPVVYCAVRGGIDGVSNAYLSYDKSAKFSTITRDLKNAKLKPFAENVEFSFSYSHYETTIDTTPEQKAAYDAYIVRKTEEDRKAELRKKKAEEKRKREQEAWEKKLKEEEAERKRKAQIQKKLSETEDLALALSILEAKGLQVVVVKDGNQVV